MNLSYLSNHFELNKINRRAHTAVAGLAATDLFSVCLTTVVVRSSVHYQGITLKQPPVKPGRAGGLAGGERRVNYDRICCLWTLFTRSLEMFCRLELVWSLPAMPV